jgi:hypothetical protein
VRLLGQDWTQISALIGSILGAIQHTGLLGNSVTKSMDFGVFTEPNLESNSGEAVVGDDAVACVGTGSLTWLTWASGAKQSGSSASLRTSADNWSATSYGISAGDRFLRREDFPGG